MVTEQAILRMISKLLHEHGLFIKPGSEELVIDEIRNLLHDRDDVEFFYVNGIKEDTDGIRLIWFGQNRSSPRVTIEFHKMLFLSTREEIKGHELYCD